MRSALLKSGLPVRMRKDFLRERLLFVLIIRTSRGCGRIRVSTIEDTMRSLSVQSVCKLDGVTELSSRIFILFGFVSGLLLVVFFILVARAKAVVFETIANMMA